MKIRRAKKIDAIALARLHRGTIRAINSRDYTPEQVEVWANRSTAHRFAESTKGTIRFVAVEGKKIVGFADYNKTEGLTGLYVHKAFQGKGIGQALLERLERHAFSCGLRKLKCLATLTAVGFYRRNGYRIIRRTGHRVGEQKLPVYEMERKIGN